VGGVDRRQRIAVTCDVTKRADIDALIRATRDAFGGRIDVVVNKRRLDAPEPAAAGSRRGDLRQGLRDQRQEHLPHDPRGRAADAPAESGVILNVGSTAAIRLVGAHLVQQFEGRREPDEQSSRSNSAGQTSASTDLPGDRRDRPARGVHGMPDTPKTHRNSCGRSRSAGCPGRSTSRARRSTSASDEAEFITGVEFPVRRRRTV